MMQHTVKHKRYYQGSSEQQVWTDKYLVYITF